ncbi:MAG: flagellar biosynthetic protein FliO [Proteobacteria bacterium]|nr:flagellar biosynthetic protein FliO [Pseudomonadota bacterium]
MELFPALLKMISALAVVLGVMLAAMYFFRKIMSKTGAGGGDGEFIKVISNRYLGPKSSIMLVDVLGSIIVIGISNNQMSMLTTISDPQSLERLKYLDQEKKKAPSFLDHLSRRKKELEMKSEE